MICGPRRYVQRRRNNILGRHRLARQMTHDLPVIKYERLVTQVDQFFVVCRQKQYRHAAIGQSAQQRVNLRFGFDINPTRWIGQKHTARPQSQPFGQRHFLLIATRQLCDGLIQAVTFQFQRIEERLVNRCICSVDAVNSKSGQLKISRNALLWDQIASVRYKDQQKKVDDFLPSLKVNHHSRTQTDVAFADYVDTIEKYKKSRENRRYTLNEEKRRTEKEKNKKSDDDDDQENENEDFLLAESNNILADYIYLLENK